MPLNDHAAKYPDVSPDLHGVDLDTDGAEFDSQLEDEDIFDAHPPPGIEMLGFSGLEVDRGSGSFAQDGRLEVAEDHVPQNGEDVLLGSAAMYGPTEIGYDEVGEIDDVGAAAAADRPGSEIGSFAEDGGSEIGHGPASEDGQSEIGQYAEDGASEIGQYAEDGASEIGQFAEDGASEIGSGLTSEEGQSEIGHYADVMTPGNVTPFESFMSEPTRIGYGLASEEGQSEIGAAVARVIEKARDNRQPAPPMRAVDPESPVDDFDDWGLGDVIIGAAAGSGKDLFPLTTQLLQRAGAMTEPRLVRVDTEESYKQFRTEHSPELADLAARLEAHESDPHAHESGGFTDEPSSDLSDDIDDLVHLGEEVEHKEQSKRVELWMPTRFDGKLEAWREGDYVCASLALPGRDGEVRICTSLEPIRKCVEEMSRHAAESGVSASLVGGALPVMGCVLGAGTALKEMAAAAPSILSRPEASGRDPFVVRIEPKTSPGIAALAMLAAACKAGSAQACEEWRRLGDLSAAPIRQAMSEALEIAKAAA